MPYKDKEKQKAYQKAWSKQNHEKDKRRGRVNKSKQERKDYCNKIALNHGCLICGYKRCSQALEFHHMDSSLKTSEISTMVRYLASYEKIDAEIKKCVVLCSNCHRELHAKIIKLPYAGVTQSAEVSVSKAEC